MLTARIERHVRESFDAGDAELVLSALAEWRISYEPDPPSERLIAAVVFMADGEIVEVGTPEHFFTDPQEDRTKLFLSQIL